MFTRQTRRENCLSKQKATKRRRILKARSEGVYYGPRKEKDNTSRKENLDVLGSFTYRGASISFGNKKKRLKHKKLKTRAEVLWRRKRNKERRQKRKKLKIPRVKCHNGVQGEAFMSDQGLKVHHLFPHLLTKNVGQVSQLDMDGGLNLLKVEPVEEKGDTNESTESNCSRDQTVSRARSRERRGGNLWHTRRTRGRDRRRSRSRSRRHEKGGPVVQPDRHGDSKEMAAGDKVQPLHPMPPQQVQPSHGWGVFSKLKGGSGRNQETPTKAETVRRANTEKSEVTAKRKLTFETEPSKTPTKKPKTFSCPFEPCTKHFAFKNKLTMHIRFSHVNESSNSPTTPDVNADNVSLFCTYCNLEFTYTHNRRQHELYYCKSKDKQDNTCINDSSEESGIHSDSEFSSTAFLESPEAGVVANVENGESIEDIQNIPLSSQSEKFPCPLCSKVFNLKCSLNRHRKWNHGMKSSSSDSENPSPHFLPMTSADSKIHSSSDSEPVHQSSNPPINSSCQENIPPISSRSTPSLTDTFNSSECGEMGSSNTSGGDNLPEDLKENKCTHCYLKFSRRFNLTRHLQRCLHIPPQQNTTEPLIVFESLKRPENWKEIKNLLKQMPPEDQFSFCQLSKMNIPGIYPIAFNTNNKSNFVTRYCCNDPHNMLKLLLEQKPHLLLPSHYIIYSEKKGTSSYIGPMHTSPKSNLYKVVTLENQISVSMESRQSCDDLLTPDLDDDEEDVIFVSDEEDVIFVSDDEDYGSSFEIPDYLKPRNIEGKREIIKDEHNKKENDVKYEDHKNCKSEDDKDDKSSEDDITHALNPNPHHSSSDDSNSSSDDSNSSTNTMPFYRRKRHTLCRTPWHLSAEDIYALTNTTKERFMTQANNYRDGCVGGRTELDYRAQYLMFRMKLAHFYSEDQLCSSAFFALKSHEVSINVFYKLLGHLYQNELAIPNILDPNAVNQAELNALFETAYRNTDPLYREIFSKFRDPLGLGRIGVPMLADGTYIDIENSSDTELNKQLYYDPRGRKTVKVIAFVSSLGKVLCLLPPCASQSPTSGDTVLLGTFLHTEDLQPVQMFRTIARGTQLYFPIFIGDAGFQMIPTRLNLQGRFVDFRQLCEAEGCIFLGTKFGEYLLRTQPVPGNPAETEIVKVDMDENLPTSARHTAKLIRFLRCKNENFHAGWKQKFQILNQHALPQKYLEKAGPKLGGKVMGLPEELQDRPKLSFIVAVCAGLYNLEHPGFPVKHLNNAQQFEKAAQIMANLNLENPHLHNVDFGINLNTNSERNWQYVRSRQLRQNNFLGFPQLDPQTFQEQIYQLTSGVHSLLKGQSVLSHVRKIEVEEMVNLTYADYERELQLPPQNLKILHFDTMNRPNDWDDNLFGQWPGPCRIYRANLPPSNKSDTARGNWKQPTIVVANDPSINRLNCSGVFERINSYHCYNCPSLNGLLGMCCHLAGLVILLSCPFIFRSTNKPVKLVNLKSRQEFQPTGILIPGHASTPIPDIQRISRNTRDKRDGLDYLLYPHSPGHSTNSSPSNSSGHSPPSSPRQNSPRQMPSPRQNSVRQTASLRSNSPRQSLPSPPNSSGQSPPAYPRQNSSRQMPFTRQNSVGQTASPPQNSPRQSLPPSPPRQSLPPSSPQNYLGQSPNSPQSQPQVSAHSSPSQALPQNTSPSYATPASPGNIPSTSSPINPVPIASPLANIPSSSARDRQQYPSTPTVTGQQFPSSSSATTSSAANGAQSGVDGDRQHASGSCMPSRGTSNNSGQLRPTDNTERYLQRLARRNAAFRIPPPTSYISPSPNFLIGALQILGLENTANNCYANAILLGLHRIGITSLLFDAAFGGERLLMIFRRIMRCFPSTESFSPQVFLTVWNSLGTNRFPLGHFQCAIEFLESLLSRFQNAFRVKSLTKFPANLNCQNCGLNQVADNYDGLVSLYMGQIDVYGINNDVTVNIPSLLQGWINRSFRSRCPRCNSPLPDTKLAPIKGKYTIVAINRSYGVSTNKSLAKLKIEFNQSVQSVNELCYKPVFYANHIGGQRNSGHWLSYTESEGNFYKNDDNRRVLLTERFDPLNPSLNTETVQIVIFETI